MHFRTVFSIVAAAAATVSGAVIASPAETTALEIRTAASCPAGWEWSGWFDKYNNKPPQCKKHIEHPKPLRKPVCPKGQVAYCSVDPGHFRPYDTEDEYCQDTGLTRIDCFDVHLGESAIEHLLGDLYCILDKALEELGLNCLLDSHKCRADWYRLDLACTLDELVWFIDHAVCEVVHLVDGILEGLGL